MSIINKLQQIVIEDRYSRHNIRDKVRDDIEDSMGDKIEHGVRLIEQYMAGKYYQSKQDRIQHIRWSEFISPEEIVLEICIAVMPHSGEQPIHGIVSAVANCLGYDDTWDGIKTASELVAVVCDTDIYDVITARDSESGSISIESNYRLEERTLQVIADTKYLPPMLCVPNFVGENKCKQYITKKESIILGTGNHHEKKQAYDVINFANGIALELDERMLKYEEKSKKPLDTVEKKANFRRMVLASKVVYQEILDYGNKFYFTHKFDKRGRFYTQGYHINIQSTSYKKSIINLAHKEIIEL